MKKKRKSCQASHLKVTDIASLYGEVSFNQASSIFFSMTLMSSCHLPYSVWVHVLLTVLQEMKR